MKNVTNLSMGEGSKHLRMKKFKNLVILVKKSFLEKQ